MTTTENIYFFGVAFQNNERTVVIGNAASKATSVDIVGVSLILEEDEFDISPDKLYSVAVENVSWHFIQDDENFVYFLMTKKDYPNNWTLTCLDYIIKEFSSSISKDDAARAKEGRYNSVCKTIFQKVCKKYDSVDDVDKIVASKRKLQNVQLKMRSSIDTALSNCSHLENLAGQAEALEHDSLIFKKNARKLRNKVWWHDCCFLYYCFCGCLPQA